MRILFAAECRDCLRNYADGFHHPLEDRRYGRMRLAVTDAAKVRLLDHIELQHAWMQVLSRRLEGYLEAIVNGQVTPLLRMSHKYRAYFDLAEEHVACENRHRLAAVEQYLRPEHLEGIMMEVTAVQDPCLLPKNEMLIKGSLSA